MAANLGIAPNLVPAPPAQYSFSPTPLQALSQPTSIGPKREYIVVGLLLITLLGIVAFRFGAAILTPNRLDVRFVFDNRLWSEAQVKNTTDHPIYDVWMDVYTVAVIAPSDIDNPAIERKIPVEVTTFHGSVPVLQPHQWVTFRFGTSLSNIGKDCLYGHYALSPGGNQVTEAPVWHIATGPIREQSGDQP